MSTRTTDLVAWARSGAMHITGRSDAPPAAEPAPIAAVMIAAASDLLTQTSRWGRPVAVDGPALMGERAAFTGMTRNGDVSVGGAARFARVADGWVVLNLPRPEDVAALPALVRADVAPDDWPAISRRLATRTAREVVEAGSFLGLAVAAPGSGSQLLSPARELRRGVSRVIGPRPLVVDLSSLWAGPLISSLLLEAGARVIKVEGRDRTDGARRGPKEFFDLLNHGKECLTVDFDLDSDRRFLRHLLGAADLVVEGSRPRAMDQLGVDPYELVEDGVSWLSVTGHGRTGDEALRVAFGDDAAVAGGLYLPGDPPGFVADAVADPIAGLVGAALGAELLALDHAALIEVPLVRVAAWAARPPVTASVRVAGEGFTVDIAGELLPVAQPHHRAVPGPAAPAGSHGAALRTEFGR